MFQLLDDIPMQRRMLFNPSNTEAITEPQECKDFWKPSKPCHVDIHWKALTEYSQMSIHMLGFQSFFFFVASFCTDHINHQQHKG